MDTDALEWPVMNVIMARGDEPTEERMGRVGFAEEFGMILAGYKKRVIFQFNHLDQFSVRRRSAENEAGFLELLAVRIVEFVTVPMTLVNNESTVQLGRFRTDDQLARL